MRTFNITDNEITIQFHYGNDNIRPTIRKYKIPPQPDYGTKIVFNEHDNPVDKVKYSILFSLFCGFFRKFHLKLNEHFPQHASLEIELFLFTDLRPKTNPYERNATKLNRFHMFLEQLRDHNCCVAAFEARMMEIKSMMVEHQNNIENPILINNVFDPLRNTAARSRRLAEVGHFVSFTFLWSYSTHNTTKCRLIKIFGRFSDLTYKKKFIEFDLSSFPNMCSTIGWKKSENLKWHRLQIF